MRCHLCNYLFMHVILCSGEKHKKHLSTKTAARSMEVIRTSAMDGTAYTYILNFQAYLLKIDVLYVFGDSCLADGHQMTPSCLTRFIVSCKEVYINT